MLPSGEVRSLQFRASGTTPRRLPGAHVGHQILDITERKRAEEALRRARECASSGSEEFRPRPAMGYFKEAKQLVAVKL